ncbi:MAG TPA: ABC transporter ATP-binding protein [Acidimicrobiia bacterium]|jgi:branched-chain amino acid transport system ATP-binding protein|nr:ABC transporter ATP-binding protein [Acidimicrobiia bacterium]
MALLEVTGLRAGYGRLPVIFGIELTVEEGEIVALLGLNGAGKTTTLRAISGMIPVMAGTVRFAGEDVTGQPAERITRRGLLHVPEGRGIFPNLRVDESLRLSAALAKLDAAEAGRRVDEAFATFPSLERRRSQAAGTLSGGEQQMLALARALIWKPRLLMVDEMSQGLAPAIVDRLFEIVGAFRDNGTALILVEQFVTRALAVADRAYVVEKGEIGYSGTAAALAADEEFVRSSYLGDTSEPAPVGAAAAAGAPGPRVRSRDLMTDVNVSLPPALLRGLEERAERDGLDIDEFIRQALEETKGRTPKEGS